MLTAAVENHAALARITALGLIAARRAREQGPDRLAAVVTGVQLAAIAQAVAGVEAMLTEQDLDSTSEGDVLPVAFAGFASDGRDLDSLLRLADTDWQFDMIVRTQLADVARATAATSMASRPAVTGYTRMVTAGACSRCVILAGKWFGWNDGFERHPGCNCDHVPVGDRPEGHLISDPREYFDRLSREEQDRTFTVAGAEAIRRGADMNQVVNARRGMQTAQIAGQQVVATSEGATRRGVGRDYRGSTRIMPETILSIAEDRADALRLLRLYGYITT